LGRVEKTHDVLERFGTYLVSGKVDSLPSIKQPGRLPEPTSFTEEIPLLMKEQRATETAVSSDAETARYHQHLDFILRFTFGKM